MSARCDINEVRDIRTEENISRAILHNAAMLPETALNVGRHSLNHYGRTGLISPVNVPNTTATLHSENRYLEGKAIFLISKTHIP